MLQPAGTVGREINIIAVEDGIGFFILVNLHQETMGAGIGLKRIEYFRFIQLFPGEKGVGSR
jgi:hypothetical protein